MSHPQPTTWPLRALREARGLSQLECAHLGGCGIGFIVRVERGAIAGARLGKLVQLAAGLGVSVVDLAPALGVRPKRR